MWYFCRGKLNKSVDIAKIREARKKELEDFEKLLGVLQILS